MAQLMPLLLTFSCFSKIQIDFTFLVPAHLGSPRQRVVKPVCVCVRAYVCVKLSIYDGTLIVWSYLALGRGEDLDCRYLCMTKCRKLKK